MKIQREDLLADLEMVRAGLSPREFIEQSSCFVFQDGWVMTFNDEVACRKKVELSITGAVPAEALVNILQKLDDPDLKFRCNDKGELEFRGRSKGFGMTIATEIFLPIDRVETPEKWYPLAPEFAEAVGWVMDCVSRDESKFTLTCVHLHPDYIEACDNYQAMRWKMKQPGLDQSTLVRGTSMGHITQFGMDKMALTKSWIHFRNKNGLIFSFRRYDEEYPDLSPILAVKGHPITIPKGVKDVSDRASVFAKDDTGDPLVTVSLSQGIIRITGQGLVGWYKEAKKVHYDGPPIQFRITPDLLRHVSEKYQEARVQEDKLRAVAGNWQYVAFLSQTEEPEAKE